MSVNSERTKLLKYLIKLANFLDQKQLTVEADLVDSILMKLAEKPKDLIPGGKADQATKKKFDEKQLELGIKEELEHTNDRDVAREIAMDHLIEDPKYYSHLEECHFKASSIKKARMDAPENFDNLPPVNFEEPKGKEWYLVYYWRGPKETFEVSNQPYAEIMEVDGPFSLSEGREAMKEAEREFIMGVSDGIPELMPTVEKSTPLETIFHLKSSSASPSGISVYKLIKMPPSGKLDTSIFSHIQTPEDVLRYQQG